MNPTVINVTETAYISFMREFNEFVPLLAILFFCFIAMKLMGFSFLGNTISSIKKGTKWFKDNSKDHDPEEEYEDEPEQEVEENNVTGSGLSVLFGDLSTSKKITKTKTMKDDIYDTSDMFDEEGDV